MKCFFGLKQFSLIHLRYHVLIFIYPSFSKCPFYLCLSCIPK